MAEGKLTLFGFGEAPDGNWSIQRVEHTLNHSGLSSTVSLQTENKD